MTVKKVLDCVKKKDLSLNNEDILFFLDKEPPK